MELRGRPGSVDYGKIGGERMSKIEEIRSRCEAATPGPWDSAGADNCSYAIFNNETPEKTIMESDEGVMCVNDSDIDFITRAREDIPFLLAEIEQLNESAKRIGNHLQKFAESLQMELEREQPEPRATPTSLCTSLADAPIFCADCPFYGEPNGCNRPDGECKAWDIAQDAAYLIESLQAQLAEAQNGEGENPKPITLEELRHGDIVWVKDLVIEEVECLRFDKFVDNDVRFEQFGTCVGILRWQNKIHKNYEIYRRKPKEDKP